MSRSTSSGAGMGDAEVIEVATPEAMEALGGSVARMLRAGDVLVLSGDLGAGKTTFTRGLGEALGVRGPVTSPTFVLARTHPNLGDGPALVHVDAYRLDSALELDDLDIDFARSVVVVEWGEGLIEALAESYLAVRIDRPHGAAPVLGSSASEGEEPIEPRSVTVRRVGPRWR
ncbi:tRNA (adenosine(37)-N6)-threonylcarbamoyltransferase complex ATPase subunit type 1 TsaE [Cnuibacter physcomitrellae]|uniref:tRNA (adenosine(37)-N6)-threonylcarbamoyltransferase complex ATPase subunit type 1 TsaE n=1 Tax=Cnuibacter physcomitrellae TaxID=1619308 RepID=UPI0028774C74|nr:tRNA (adenosine(37)-N6)-threonylcarbamoyltransferase complex ATPase subunit type 1 TsaE [Cnuibacter physcomitrellae]